MAKYNIIVDDGEMQDVIARKLKKGQVVKALIEDIRATCSTRVVRGYWHVWEERVRLNRIKSCIEEAITLDNHLIRIEAEHSLLIFYIVKR